MKVRFFVFLFLILFVCSLLYSATTNQQGSNSGSSTLGKPSVKFKSWQVGRSDVGMDLTNIVHTSFITSTQDKCHFTVSVGAESQ